MVIVFRKKGGFGFILPISLINVNGINTNNFYNLENMPIIRDKRGFTLVGSEDTLQFNIISEHISELKDLKTVDNVLENVNTIKTILEDHYMICENGKIRNSFVLADNSHAYLINYDFKTVEIHNLAVACNKNESFDDFIPLIDMEKGSLEEKAINAVKKYTKLVKGKESKLLLMNSNNDNIEII